MASTVPSSGSLAQIRNPAAKPRYRLMVPRVHIPRLPLCDAREHGAGLDRHAVSGQTSVRSAPDMALGAWQVLYQAAAQMHIQQLHPAANRQQRKVASQRFVDQRGLRRRRDPDRAVGSPGMRVSP